MKDVSIYEKIWIKIVSVALGIMGFINIISAWFSYDSFRFKFIKNIFDYEIIQGSRYLVVMTGIVAILIAPKLYLQKRIAWYISIVLLAISGIAHIIKGADVEESTLCILLLGILLPLYKYCYVKSDPIRVQRSGTIIIGSGIFILSYTFVGLHFFADKLSIPNDLSLWHTGLEILFFDVSSLRPQSIAAKFFSNSILLVNSSSILVGLILALSPVIARSLPDITLKKYMKIARKYAIQPIQIFTLTKDYIHFPQCEDPKEYISYQVADGVAMAIGNPCTSSSGTFEFE